MGIISPINLNKWLPNTPIISSEAKAEFMNLYNLVNGNLDTANIKNNSITSNKLQDGSVTESKFTSVPASKITGRLAESNLPLNTFTTAGGELTGTIVFRVSPTTALLKNYDNEEVILYEGGTGAGKIQIFVGGTNVMKIVRGGVVLWTLQTDGMEIPKAFKVPQE